MKIKETNIQMTGYEMLEKVVGKSGDSGRIYAPVDWVGKKVKIVLVEK
jgi:putative transposon-encoded protein